LGLLGSNENGQLGLEIKRNELLDLKSQLNILNTSELKIFEFEGTKDYDIMDISAADDFTLVLIKFKNEKKFGKKNFLYKFAINLNSRIKTMDDSVNPISKEDFKYEDSSNIIQLYATSERIVLLTEDNSVFVKGSDFNLEIHYKYKEIIRKYSKGISYLCLGKNHCLFMLSNVLVY
jgi:alpha-tubulin suppressor-like RCC1 family protein